GRTAILVGTDLAMGRGGCRGAAACCACACVCRRAAPGVPAWSRGGPTYRVTCLAGGAILIIRGSRERTKGKPIACPTKPQTAWSVKEREGIKFIPWGRGVGRSEAVEIGAGARATGKSPFLFGHNQVSLVEDHSRSGTGSVACCQ